MNKMEREREYTPITLSGKVAHFRKKARKGGMSPPPQKNDKTATFIEKWDCVVLRVTWVKSKRSFGKRVKWTVSMASMAFVGGHDWVPEFCPQPVESMDLPLTV